jgi:hypothetical protein
MKLLVYDLLLTYEDRPIHFNIKDMKSDSMYCLLIIQSCHDRCNINENPFCIHKSIGGHSFKEEKNKRTNYGIIVSNKNCANWLAGLFPLRLDS